eukprot:4914068-Amphidinium_carterae.1
MKAAKIQDLAFQTWNALAAEFVVARCQWMAQRLRPGRTFGQVSRWFVLSHRVLLLALHGPFSPSQ